CRSAPAIVLDAGERAFGRECGETSRIHLGQVRAGLPQHFLYLRAEPHQQGALRSGGHGVVWPRAARSAAECGGGSPACGGSFAWRVKDSKSLMVPCATPRCTSPSPESRCSICST